MRTLQAPSLVDVTYFPVTLFLSTDVPSRDSRCANGNNHAHKQKNYYTITILFITITSLSIVLKLTSLELPFVTGVVCDNITARVHEIFTKCLVISNLKYIVSELFK